MGFKAPKWGDLRSLPEDELIARHDDLVTRSRVSTSVTYYLEELRYRRQLCISAKVERFTKLIFWLTLIVTAATILNVIVASRGSLSNLFFPAEIPRLYPLGPRCYVPLRDPRSESRFPLQRGERMR